MFARNRVPSVTGGPWWSYTQDLTSFPGRVQEVITEFHEANRVTEEVIDPEPYLVRLPDQYQDTFRARIQYYNVAKKAGPTASPIGGFNCETD